MIWPSSAFAQICVELDLSKDGLSEQEQKSAVPLLTETFAGEGEETTDAPCDDVYKVYHLKFGNAVTVVVSGAKGTRKLRVNSLEEIPNAYSQIARALIAGTEITTVDTKTRKNVTDRQADPNRVKSDNLVYVNLGAGYTMGGTESAYMDTAYGFGYRYELDNLGLDVSFRVQMASEDRREFDEPEFGQIDTEGHEVPETVALSGNLRAFYFSNPSESATFYYGGGMSYGVMNFYRHDKEWGNAGLMANGTVGYEFMRTSTIRMFVESNVYLPFFSASDDLESSRWVPQMMVVVGGAWTKLPGSDCCF